MRVRSRPASASTTGAAAGEDVGLTGAAAASTGVSAGDSATAGPSAAPSSPAGLGPGRESTTTSRRSATDQGNAARSEHGVKERRRSGFAARAAWRPERGAHPRV